MNIADLSTLRSRGINVEVQLSAIKFPKQIRYATRKGIPYVWFLSFEDGRSYEVKNLTTGEQTPADPEVCKP
ncbi:His/Gly/Thr/Pro-type tRNA ligase C-terminal domain-containing protein [Aneurinibacillus tyrosinisolvens]|uniref:His/Gly/Thr/Pro-type tRNA ligase C-terminal domain-containing protein n=1 Tax=Aneurinibacillus tyrosinisolvens TaxID=1443435 RepID=UPI0009E40430